MKNICKLILKNTKTQFPVHYILHTWGVGVEVLSLWVTQVCAAVKVWFSSSVLWDRVYKSQNVGLEQGIFFQETDQLVEDFSLDQGNRELPLKNMKKSTRFCFGWTVFVTSIVSGKQLLQDKGVGGWGFWQFRLVQGSKIHLNELWYRLRVPGSQRHITTQKFLKYPPSDYIPLLVQNLSCLCQTVLFCKELLRCLDPDPTPVFKFKNTQLLLSI